MEKGERRRRSGWRRENEISSGERERTRHLTHKKRQMENK